MIALRADRGVGAYGLRHFPPLFESRGSRERSQRAVGDVDSCRLREEAVGMPEGQESVKTGVAEKGGKAGREEWQNVGRVSHV